MHDAGGAVFIDDDDRHAASNADGGGGRGDDGVRILGDASADEAQNALGHRHRKFAASGRWVVDVFVQLDDAVLGDRQRGLIEEQKLTGTNGGAFDQLIPDKIVAERQLTRLLLWRRAVDILIERGNRADRVRGDRGGERRGGQKAEGRSRGEACLRHDPFPPLKCTPDRERHPHIVDVEIPNVAVAKQIVGVGLDEPAAFEVKKVAEACAIVHILAR